jgi:hypothetical protein
MMQGRILLGSMLTIRLRVRGGTGPPRRSAPIGRPPPPWRRPASLAHVCCIQGTIAGPRRLRHQRESPYSAAASQFEPVDIPLLEDATVALAL